MERMEWIPFRSTPVLRDQDPPLSETTSAEGNEEVSQMPSPTQHTSRSRRRFAVAALAAGTMLFAAACGSGGSTSTAGGESTGTVDKPITLTFSWWVNDDRAIATKKVTDLYESKNPGVKIETSYAADTAYWPKLATQVAGGSPPDIMQMKLELLKEYAGRGVLADLTKDVGAGDGKIATDQIPPQYLAAGKVKDVTYGLPTGRATQGFIYDPAVWKKAGLQAPAAGWTWDDLRAAGKKISESTNGSMVAMSDFGNNQAWFEFWLLQHGKSVYTDAGKLNFSKEDLAQFWAFTLDLSKSGVTTAPSVTSANDWTMANSPLVRKLAAGEVNNTSLASAYFQSFGEVAIAPIPADKSAVSTGGYAGVTQLLTVSQKSEHKAAATKFINFFINDPEAGKLLGLVRGMPANRSVLDAIAPTFAAGDKITYDFENVMAKDLLAKPPVAPKGGSTSLTDFTNAYDEIIFGKTTVADGAAAMYQKFQDNIS